MIPLLNHRDDAILVVGLGKSGRSAASALTNVGARVSVWDDDADKRAQAGIDGLSAIDIETVDMSKLDGVIWSPGVPHTHPRAHPLAEKARAAGHILRCDIDLLATAQPDAEFIGITGTNGKSTTTALTGHVLSCAGKISAVGGNLGMPALDLSPLGADGIYVLELSSYQIELSPNLACDTAALLNIASDHLERHGGLDGYIAAKTELFARQHAGATAIVGIDDDQSNSIFEALAADGAHHVIGISVTDAVEGGIYVGDGWLIDALDGNPKRITDLRALPTLPGYHNWQNAAASYAVTRTHGLDADDIASAFATFPGLPHRQEFVGTSADVMFVNDSKATNVAAAEKALACYSCIYWIAGGQAKNGGIAALDPLFGRIRHAFLIGEAANDFAKNLRQAGVAASIHDSLEDAVLQAGKMAITEAKDGATVLLSPACASFDMFDNFEERGNAFRKAVHGGWPDTTDPLSDGRA